MDAIADLADRYSFGEIRVGHEQNLALPHVAQRDLPALWRALDEIGVATPNVNLISDIIACPGLDYCSLANARSIPVARGYHPPLRGSRPRATISDGCTSTFPAASTPAAIIMSATSAFSASRRTARNSTRSRSAAAPTRTPSSARSSGPAVPYGEIADVVEDIAAAYLELRERPDELFVDTVKRLGVEPFKERVYATR